jgi:hypothetical protein
VKSGRAAISAAIHVADDLGMAAKDPDARAFSGRAVTFADGSMMRFGPTPDDGDRWNCVPAPCSYKYPDVGSQ